MNNLFTALATISWSPVSIEMLIFNVSCIKLTNWADSGRT